MEFYFHVAFLLFVSIANGYVIQAIYEYPFEKANPKQNPFQVGYSSCRGITINGIHLVQCAAICCDPTSPLWDTEGYFADGQHDYCYCFLFNETEQVDTGSCTVCFEDSSLPFLLDLNNVISTFMFATPSVLCKYLILYMLHEHYRLSFPVKDLPQKSILIPQI